MLIELESIIFDVAGKVDLTHGVAPKDIYDQSILELKRGFPTVNIAPYDELIFGTAFAVHLSRILAIKGVILTPDQIANALLNELKKDSQGVIEVFLGEKTFVNFRLTQSFITKHCSDLLRQEAAVYLEIIFDRLLSCINKKLQIDLEREFRFEISLRKDFDYDGVISKFDQKQKNEFFLNYISDDEAEETVLERESDFNKIISQIGAEFAPNTKLFSQSPYTSESSKKRVIAVNSRIKRFMLIFPFLLFDTLKQSKVKILYQEYVEVRGALSAIWTDKLVREKLLNCQVFDQGEIAFLREGIMWVRKLDEILRKKLGI